MAGDWSERGARVAAHPSLLLEGQCGRCCCWQRRWRRWQYFGDGVGSFSIKSGEGVCGGSSNFEQKFRLRRVRVAEVTAAAAAEITDKQVACSYSQEEERSETGRRSLHQKLPCLDLAYACELVSPRSHVEEVAGAGSGKSSPASELETGGGTLWVFVAGACQA